LGAVRVRFRLTPRQITIQSVIVLSSWSSIVLINLRLGGAQPLLLSLYGAAFVGFLVLTARWRGMELTPEGVVLRRNRTRTVPWSDVLDVRPGSMLWTRLVVFDTPNGPVRSWAPTTSPLLRDPDFDAKLHYVRQWWWASRAGGDETPLWPVAGSTGWGVPVTLDESAAM
jgi:hypothetical protein